ncbi:hypothetical protein DW261_02540 [Fusobacterium varium]|uniref:hypothetical protein n=1 Tax=Fusobacterium varium TaxID=856 RepID=UPI000E50FC17|nr:hypothetical protein [Fusobacterium varium]RHG37868.1 hypothetical protein DW261_02540 [Fusobacterium varium]
MFNRNEEFEETEKDRKRKNKENHLEKIMELFNGKESFEKLLLELKVTKESFLKIFEGFLEDEEKLIKNKKINKKEVYSENREFFSELEKIEYNKDISNMKRKLICKIYKENFSRISVDFNNDFYLDGKNIFFMKKEEKEKYKDYSLLILLRELGDNLIDKEEAVKKNIFSKNFNMENSSCDIKEIREKIILGLKKIKLEIKNESCSEKRIMKYLLVFFHVYYYIILNKFMIKVIEKIIEENIEIPLEARIDNSEKTTTELLEKIRFNKESKKDNYINEKIKSIEIYHVNSTEDMRIMSIQPEIRNLVIGNYYRAIYLSNIKYKGKKLSSYLEAYRKAEFILILQEIIERNRLDLNILKETIDHYFTIKEIKKILEKSEVELGFDEIDAYSVEEEEKYIKLIIKEIIGSKGEVKFNDKILNNVKNICESYVALKKKYGEFEENIGMKRDVKNIINYYVGIYSFANEGNENLSIKCFKEIVEYLKISNKENIEKVTTLE